MIPWPRLWRAAKRNLMLSLEEVQHGPPLMTTLIFSPFQGPWPVLTSHACAVSLNTLLTLSQYKWGVCLGVSPQVWQSGMVMLHLTMFHAVC